ncbi:MAG: hypothetical protein AB7V13_26365, partial [Pseudorhodoplanes sp.]
MINGHSQAYLQAAIDGEIGRLSSAQPGERNNSLFRASISLASLGMREGQIIHHLRPAAKIVGLRGKEFYSTVKSGVRAGHANPRSAPPICQAGVPEANPGVAPTGLPQRSPATEGRRPAFFLGGDEGPRSSADEIRRHVYRREGKLVRIKVKRPDGYVNWYRVSDGRGDGWQSGKPAGYTPCPYVGAVNPFDPEVTSDVVYWP